MVTNGIKENQYMRLSLSGLGPYTHAMVTSEEVGAPKPEGLIFEEALRRCGNPPREECVLIGDSLAADVRGSCFIWGGRNLVQSKRPSCRRGKTAFYSAKLW